MCVYGCVCGCVGSCSHTRGRVRAGACVCVVAVGGGGGGGWRYTSATGTLEICCITPEINTCIFSQFLLLDSRASKTRQHSCRCMVRCGTPAETKKNGSPAAPFFRCCDFWSLQLTIKGAMPGARRLWPDVPMPRMRAPSCIFASAISLPAYTVPFYESGPVSEVPGSRAQISWRN